MGLKRTVLTAASLLGLAGCANDLDLVKQDDYVRHFLDPNTVSRDFDRDEASATPTKKGNHRVILDTHHMLSEERNQHNIRAKYIAELGNDWVFIAYAADTYADNNGKVTDSLTNSGRADARIGKYLEAGKNVLAYVEVSGRVEVFAYTNGLSDMNYTTGNGLLRAGLVRRNSKGEKTTKLQGDLHIGKGPYNWNFPGGTLEGQIVKVMGVLHASQKLPFNIKNVDRINLVAHGQYTDTHHNGFMRQQIGAAEAGAEFVLDKIFLGKEMRIAVYGGARQEITNYTGKDPKTNQFGTGRMSIDWKLNDRIRALLGWKYDAKNGLGAEAGIGFEFGGK